MREKKLCVPPMETRLLLEHVSCTRTVRIKGSCDTSDATKKGALKLWTRNDQDKNGPVALEVLLVRDLGANIFSIDSLAEKGVMMCDLMSTPPALPSGNHTFLISTAVPRTYVVNIIDDPNLDAVAVCIAPRSTPTCGTGGWGTAILVRCSSWWTKKLPG